MARSRDLYLFGRNLDENDSPGRFRNNIREATKKPGLNEKPDQKKFANIWYYKFLDNINLAVNETAAQEIFRLYLPRQPKTRLVDNDVVSKKIAGNAVCIEGSTDNKFNCANGIFKGLGEILVLALLVREIDLKFGNLFVNESKEIVKIDGDLCLQYDEFPSPTDIEMLPMLKDFHPSNWLDIFLYKINDFPQASKIFPTEFSQQSKFREEVNRTILKILLTPKAVFSKLLKDILIGQDNHQEVIYKKIIASRNKLYAAAMQNASFKNYLLSNDVSEVFKTFRIQLQNFQTKGKKNLEFSKDLNVYQRNLSALVEKVTKEKKEIYQKQNRGKHFMGFFNSLSKKAHPQNTQQTVLVPAITC